MGPKYDIEVTSNDKGISDSIEEQSNATIKGRRLAKQISAGIRTPSVWICVVSLVAIGLMQIPGIPLFVVSTVTAVAGAALGAAVLSLVLDSRRYEDRIRDLSSEATLSSVAGTLAANRSVLSKIDPEVLRALCRQSLVVRRGLCRNEDVDQITDLCMTEIGSRLTGLYSSQVDISRQVEPVIGAGGAVVAWRMTIETNMTLKSAAADSLDSPLSDSLTSGSLSEGIPGANILDILEFSIEGDGELLFCLNQAQHIACIHDDNDRRIWSDYFPKDDKIPTSIEPGQMLRYRYVLSFLTPCMETVRVRWFAPRKGIKYRVAMRNLQDITPELSLTGCSRCDGKRHHRCANCADGNGVIEISENAVEIRNEWVGFDMGINIDWRKKKHSDIAQSC